MSVDVSGRHVKYLPEASEVKSVQGLFLGARQNQSLESIEYFSSDDGVVNEKFETCRDLAVFPELEQPFPN